jgi:hypothetical protein
MVINSKGYLKVVDKRIDRPEQVVGGNMSFERELIEQCSLLDPMPHPAN